jgi:MYXO-CTERM domain-containing protein
VDTCAGVMCPGGGACVNGACQMATGGTSSTGGSGGIDLGGSLSLGGSKNSGPGADPDSGGGAVVKDPGCACRAAGSPQQRIGLALALLGVGLAFGRRRRAA